VRVPLSDVMLDIGDIGACMLGRMNESRKFKQKRALRLVVALPVATIGLGVSASAAFAAGAPSPSAASLAASVKKAMIAAKSVHFEVTSAVSGTDEHIVADAGTSTGRQYIKSGSSVADVLVTPTDAYFDGNKSGLSTFFDMPAADITKVGKKWVDIKAGTTQYKSFKAGIVISALPASFLPTAAQAKTAKVLLGTGSGKSLYALTWTVTSSGSKINETLDVDASGTYLPIKAVGVEGKNHTLTTFSKWGEKIALVAPKTLIPFTKLTS